MKSSAFAESVFHALKTITMLVDGAYTVAMAGTDLQTAPDPADVNVHGA